MLLDIHKEANVPLIDAFDTEYPAYFLHPLVEYDALVSRAGVIDLTHWRVIHVNGRDRAGFLHAMLTADITSLATGQGCHSTMTTVRGKIMAELFVFARENDHLVLMPSGDLDDVITTLEKHIITEDVTIRDVSDEFGVVAVEGPKAVDIVKRLFLTGAVALPANRFEHVDGRFETFELTVINNTCAGDGGYQLVIPAGEAARIYQYLVQAARGSDGYPAGHTAWNIRRVENGIPWRGIDYTDDNFPPESRLDHTVSYTKGCFRGQETLGRIHNRGEVNWLLVGMTVRAGVGGALAKLRSDIEELLSHADENGLRERANTDAALFDMGATYPAGLELYTAGAGVAGKPQGRITSTVLSPRLGDCLMFGLVRKDALESAAEFELLLEGNSASPALIDLPLE